MVKRLTYQECVEYLGQPHHINQARALWQCPDCKDEGKNNLDYTFAKGLLTSWCCESSKRIYGEIIAKRTQDFKVDRIPPKKEITEDQSIKLWEQHWNNTKRLWDNEKALQYLEQKRGLNRDTAAYMEIGLTENKHWSFPMFNNESGLIGFEYRMPDFSKFEDGLKIHKSKGYWSCFASITGKGENLIILEGFLDGYSFYQIVKDKGQEDKWHILTPSNGVGTIFGLIKSIEFNNYKEIYVWLDKDKPNKKGKMPGQEMTLQCIKAYPFIKSRMNECDCCKDCNDYLLNHILKKEAK